MAGLRATTDGLVTIRPPEPGDASTLVAGRDAEWVRFLGPGDDDPRPTGCIEVAGEVVGWVDADPSGASLAPGEVNVGYNVFAARRGVGYATRAVQLLLHHLAVGSDHRTARLLIHPDNEASLALAARTGFVASGTVDGERHFTRPVPPLTYTDGDVTIRPQRAADLDADLDAKDDEQIDRLWLPGQRQAWEAMSSDEWRAHALRILVANAEAFTTGPKWSFSVEAGATPYVAYVDCDLANDHVALGDANISYACHPAHRGRAHVSRAVRLVLQFLAEHTGARAAHILVDADNLASLRVVRAVGAQVAERWTDDHGRQMVRHVRTL